MISQWVYVYYGDYINETSKNAWFIHENELNPCDSILGHDNAVSLGVPFMHCVISRWLGFWLINQACVIRKTYLQYIVILFFKHATILTFF